jgi:putative acyl-CoA dehydrogenase
MPRLYREAPLNSIWEGSGNVNSLDVLRAMVKTPEAVDAFRAEIGAAAGAEPRLDRYGAAIARDLGDVATLEFRARGLVERMAIALQASILVRFGDPTVADAFCATRLDGDHGRSLGTLPAGVDCARIIERHRPHL